jgi:hypothetical protein
MGDWRLKPGETLSAVAGLTLLGLMSATWFEHPTNAEIPADALGFQTTPNAWQSFAVIDWALFAAVLCTLSAVLVSATDRRLRLPLDAGAVIAVLGVVCAALIGYRVIDPIEIAGVTYRRDVALFLGLGATGLIAIGGLWTLRDRATSIGRELGRAARRNTAESLRRRPAKQAYGVGSSSQPAAGRLSLKRR